MYGKPIDIRRAKRAYFRQYGTEAFASLSRDVIATVIRTATGHGDRHLPGFSLADAYLPRIGRAGFDAERGIPMAQAALAWVPQRPAVVLEEELNRLEAPYVPHSVVEYV
ncbi:hypothetical protein [Streptomyces tailanensis]|uniref:hypothetical protein n=1 Tax=Streptomyces tailanensis TaxID=2569858 RepID=UPI00155A8131|nr:hypothetical protein [Streptomyces tailanensis]